MDLVPFPTHSASGPTFGSELRATVQRDKDHFQDLVLLKLKQEKPTPSTHMAGLGLSAVPCGMALGFGDGRDTELLHELAGKARLHVALQPFLCSASPCGVCHVPTAAAISPGARIQPGLVG